MSDEFTGEAAVAKVAAAAQALREQVRRRVIGQQEVIDLLLIALIAKGHVLLTGLPGLGKTLLVRTLAEGLALSFKRVQFTPDMMPADILGTEIVEEDAATGKRIFRYVKGPLFANLVLADEINRTPPKTQAAMLEAMEERQVTAGGDTHPLPRPFFVLATQNPIELEGTYPLPEAQLDRFLFNVTMDYLSHDDEVAMVTATTAPSTEPLEAVLAAQELEELQQLVRQVPVASHVVDYAVRLAAASRPQDASAAPAARQFVQWGAGSRASQALVLGGKARALLAGRYNVSLEDIDALALPVMRHRILPNFQAQAESVTTDDLVREIIASVEVKA